MMVLVMGASTQLLSASSLIAGGVLELGDDNRVGAPGRASAVEDRSAGVGPPAPSLGQREHRRLWGRSKRLVPTGPNPLHN